MGGRTKVSLFLHGLTAGSLAAGCTCIVSMRVLLAGLLFVRGGKRFCILLRVLQSRIGIFGACKRQRTRTENSCEHGENSVFFVLWTGRLSTKFDISANFSCFNETNCGNPVRISARVPLSLRVPLSSRFAVGQNGEGRQVSCVLQSPFLPPNALCRPQCPFYSGKNCSEQRARVRKMNSL